mmetsp:Transcript_35835/g.55902  ORF Transcript_35835/g.55902 Transcript_35835/m.55902 type:complete len:133 (+) Transcript_35835:716-1114(+)
MYCLPATLMHCFSVVHAASVPIFQDALTYANLGGKEIWSHAVDDLVGISSFVEIAYGSCGWMPTTGQCVSVAEPSSQVGSSFGSTLTIFSVIAAILAVTYYAAKPAAMASEVERGEYSTLDQLPSDLVGSGK